LHGVLGKCLVLVLVLVLLSGILPGVDRYCLLAHLLQCIPEIVVVSICLLKIAVRDPKRPKVENAHVASNLVLASRRRSGLGWLSLLSSGAWLQVSGK